MKVKRVVSFIKENKLMIGSFMLIWAALLVFELMYPKIQTHLMLNGYHTPALDIFFKYATRLGEGFPVYLGLFLLIWSRKNGLLILLGQALTFIITQALKFSFAYPRPATYFQQMGADLPDTVPGVALRRAMNSFPSGHTSAAFALFTCLALIVPKKYSPLLIASAWIVAYSRIYLSQHFLEDILLGSIIGVISSCAVYMFMQYYIERKKV